MHLCIVVKIDGWAIPAPGLMKGAGGAEENGNQKSTGRLERLMLFHEWPHANTPL